MTSPLEQTLAEIARAVSEGDEVEMPRLQGYANGLRADPDDPGLLSAVIELLDEMAARRLVRMRMFARLAESGALDDTDLSIPIADLAEPGTDHGTTDPIPRRHRP